MDTHPLYLDGAWVSAERSEPVVNPATGEIVARVCVIERARVAQAIADAHTAFAGWRGLTARVRGDHLLAIAQLCDQRKETIARAITIENGKPLPQSLGEVAMTIDHLRWFAEEGRRAYGRVIPPQAEGKRNLVIKAPVGVVGAIAPWNFPLMLGVRKAAAAMAAGCPVVLKPAQKTPLSTLQFASCVHDAGLPKGVFQVVLGRASEIGDEFLENPLCRKITFTGSTEVGRTLIMGAAAGVKQLSLELGGHAPLLVFDDARLDKAVEGTLMAKFRNTGQSCIAANRIYVQRGIAERFIEAFVARVKTLKIGDGLAPGIDIGPLADQAGLDKALAHIADAVAAGARVLAGGQRVAGLPGFFLAPTVLVDVPQRALCMREETFAPIAPITVFDGETEGLSLANDSQFGLAAYAFTQDVDRAFRVMEALDAGSIGINDGVPTTSNAPFGGLKQSGWGRELGSEGLEAFLETKHVSLGGVV